MPSAPPVVCNSVTNAAGGGEPGEAVTIKQLAATVSFRDTRLTSASVLAIAQIARLFLTLSPIGSSSWVIAFTIRSDARLTGDFAVLQRAARIANLSRAMQQQGVPVAQLVFVWPS